MATQHKTTIIIRNADPQIFESIVGQLLTLADFCAYEMTTQNMLEARNIARNFFDQTIHLLD
jgi:hypothetical protein